jgi:biotin-(acetyl-CoA carboxylase) ligase
MAGWRRRDALAGRPVYISSGADRSEPVMKGVAEGVGEEGQLLVRTRTESGQEEGSLVEVYAGDVSATAQDGPGCRTGSI